MSGVTAVSGELGKAVIEGELVHRLTNWSINRQANESAWGDSDSGGFTNRKAARRDATGSIGGKLDEDDLQYNIFDDGDIVALVLWEDTTRYWVFPSALIQNFQLEFNPDTKEVVGWTADFGADGRYYKPGEAGAPVHSLPSS
jgi:hypothetical protein